MSCIIHGAVARAFKRQKGDSGAGEGNRTLVISLEGCCSTIELHPLNPSSSLHCLLRLLDHWWRGLVSNQRRRSQRIYSPSPLTTRAPLHFQFSNWHNGLHPITGRRTSLARN